MSKRILLVGDGVVSTGFAKANHAYLAGLQATGYEVHMLAMHHTGDPHDYPYPIYTCWPGGDQFGVGRIANIVRQTQPDAIVITQDPWNFPPYLSNLKEFPNIPVIGVVAVDGKNCQGDKLGPVYDAEQQVVHPGLSHAIFWTKFGAEEAGDGGWRGKSTVVPLGVDEKIYYLQDRAALRREILQPIFEKYDIAPDSFVVGSVGRNQSRKRLDLTIQYFAEWVQRKDVKDAVLWMHIAPTGDDAYDLKRLAQYFGVKGRVLVPDVNPRYGISEQMMAKVYSIFDVLLLTGLGEGWSLPTMEAMACGVPCIVPDWSALAEWSAPAAWLCACPVADAAPGIMTIGGRVDSKEVIEALNRLHKEPHSRAKLTEEGLKLVAQPQYRWENVGIEIAKIVSKVLDVNLIDVTTQDDTYKRFVQGEAVNAV